MPNRTWDKEADIVIIGYGGAGATLGMIAAEQGADVLILEKDAQGGGNSVCVAGSLILASTDDAQSLVYLDWLCGGQTEASVLRAFIARLKNIPALQAKLGFVMKENPKPFRADGFFPEFSNAPGAGSLLGMSVINAPGGAALYNAIAKVAVDKGVRIDYQTAVVRLIQHPETREILGVVAHNGEKEISIRGKKATVLACGGYEFNDEMCRRYLTPCPTYSVGSKNLTGDGVKMAQEIGAQLWHMDSFAGPLYWGIRVADNLVYTTYDFMKLAGFGYNAPMFKNAGSVIWVNKNGKRFHNETTDTVSVQHGIANRETWFAHDAEISDYINVPAFQIFDHKVFASGGAVMTTFNTRVPPWSNENASELERGWIVQADSIEALAIKCSHPHMAGVTRGGNIDSAALVATVERYNQQCHEGRDKDFGRDQFLVPLDTPPYYAVGPMLPTFINTHGGPKHDEYQRVLDQQDKPIPRLYAIGECGSLWGPYYNSMGDISEIFTSAMIAAQSVAKETAWDEE